MRHAMPILAALASLACDPRKFDDLADTVWYKHHDSPGAASLDYGSVVAGIDTPGLGAQVVILDSPQDTVHVIAYDGVGGEVDDLAETAPFPIEDGSRIHNAVDVGGGRLAISFNDNIAIYDTPLQFGGGRNVFMNPPAEITRIGKHLARGDYDTDGMPDLVTGSENAYLGFLPGLDGASLSSCRIEDDMTAPVTLDAVVAGEGSQVVVAISQGNEHSVAIVDVNLIVTEQGLDRVCVITLADETPAADIPFKKMISFAPEALAIADVDGAAPYEIVAVGGRPGNGVVIFQDGSTVALGTPGQFDCNSAGMRVTAIAANFDADATDEVLVGNPCATAADTADAGSVFVFDVTTTTATLSSTLFDAEPQDNQRFGRSLAVVPFSGENGDAPVLIVGALDEAFVFFRILAAGRDPRFASPM